MTLTADTPLSFAEALAGHLRVELQSAAEPIIQQTLDEIETALRKRLAEIVVGLVSSDYSLERDGMFVRITVKLGGK